MKKVLSIVLSLVLIFSCVVCVFTGTALAESVWGTTPKYRYEINFDNDETKNPAFDTTNTQGKVSVVSATGYDGKTSNMLHVSENETTTTVMMNNTWLSQDKDDIFSIPVKASTNYKLSWRMKANNINNLTPNWLVAYIYNNNASANKNQCGATKNGAVWTYNNADIASLQMHNDVKANTTGEWKYYETYVTTAANQEILGFFINFGHSTPEIWIDDIILEEEASYADANNWGLYSSGNLDGSAAATTAHGANDWQGVSNSTTVYSGTDDNTSIKINAHQRYLAVVLPTLEKNKKYNFSFKYYLPEGVVANAGFPDGPMKNIGIAVKGTSLISSNNNDYKASAYVATGEKMNGASGTWQEYSIEFETGENTEFVFGGHKNASTNNGSSYFQLWLDDFSLTEVVEQKPSYADANNWGIYKSGNLDGSTAATTNHSKGWPSISNDTAKDVDSDGDSIYIWGRQMYAAVVLPQLEKNKKYVFSFKYYVPAGLNISTSSGYTGFMQYAGIAVKGTALAGSTNNYHPATYVAEGDPLNGATGSWQDYSIEFSTGDNTEFVFGAHMHGGWDNSNTGVFQIWLDDFSLTEVVEQKPSYADANNWGLYSSGNLDGSAAATTAHGANDWQGVSNSTTVYSGTDDNTSIKINAHQRCLAVVLPTLEKNKKYNFSFKYYLPEGVAANTGFPDGPMKNIGIAVKGTSLISSNNNDYKASAYVATGEKMNGASGTWQEYSIEFFSGENTEFVFGGHKNASTNNGSSYFQLWLDDFSLTEVDDIYDNYYENPENWGQTTGQIFTVGDSFLTLESGCSSVTGSDYVTVGNSSLKIAPTWKNFIGVKLDNLKANTEYKLTFKHKAIETDKAGSYTYYKFLANGVYTQGTDTAYKSDTWGTVTAKKLAQGEDLQYNFGAWNDYSITFKTGDDTNAYFVTRLLANVIYLDDFKVTEVANVTYDSYYETPANWGQTNGQIFTVDDSFLALANGCSSVTGSDYVTAGNSSLKVAPTWKNFIGVKLDNLKANTKYELTFKHKAFEGNKAGSYTYYKFLANGVYAQGTDTAYKSDTWGTVTAKKLAQGADEQYNFGTWNDYSVSFKTGDDTNAYFVTRLLANIVYIDDVMVTEVSPNEPKQEYVIDFDNTSVTIREQKDRFEIVDAKNYNNKTSKMLHVIEGRYSTATTLNWATVTTDTDPDLTFAVKPNQTYQISWRLKISADSEKGTADWFSFYAYNGGVAKNIANVVNASRGEWLELSAIITTEDGQTELSFGFNAGGGKDLTAVTPEFWLDDIVIEEKNFLYYDGPEKEQVITFDDERPYAFTTETKAIVIEDGPAKEDGTVSKTMRVKGGNYPDNVVALNWHNIYKTITNEQTGEKETIVVDNDPVFSIPVKENTLYSWSGWVYIADDEEANVTFGSFYADINNRFTYFDLTKLNDNKGKWVKLETTFLTAIGQTKISNYFNLGNSVPDMWFDDFKLVELSPGVLSETEKSYCENAYNLIKRNGLSDITAQAISGVYKIPVAESTNYSFGVTAIGSGNARIYLSFDEDGKTPIGKSLADAPNSVIVPTQKEKRYAYNFVTDKSGYIYLVIDNADGSLQLKDITIFRTQSIGVSFDMGYTQAPPTDNYIPELVELKTDTSHSFGENTTESPNTGEQNTLLSLICIMLTAFTTLVMLYKKKEVHKNER